MYMQIINGKANAIEVEPNRVTALRNAGLTIIDVSSVSPQPQTGWAYDSETEEFSAEEVSTPANIYAHVALADGDGMDPIGIQNNGVESLRVSVTFRVGESPSSDIITAITGLNRRITIRNSDGAVHDIVKVAFTDGVATFDYTTSGPPGILQVLESDFETLEIGGSEYVIKLIGDHEFKVYRVL